MNNQQKRNLNEGLRYGDLTELVSNVFTVDQFKSKMGEDSDIVVLGFRVKEKYPATDLMEFIEKGFPFILDADMSAGEEYDGQYQVFVEIERTSKLPEQMSELLNGIGFLCNSKDWHFKYQKSPSTVEFHKESVANNIPLSRAAYEQRIVEFKETDLKAFFDRGSTAIALESDNTIVFSRPYSGDLTAKFIAIGDYDDVKNTVPGKLSLDESSQSQMFFLAKYIGNYEINKIGNKFLIRNGDRAVVIEKDRW